MNKKQNTFLISFFLIFSLIIYSSLFFLKPSYIKAGGYHTDGGGGDTTTTTTKETTTTTTSGTPTTTNPCEDVVCPSGYSCVPGRGCVRTGGETTTTTEETTTTTSSSCLLKDTEILLPGLQFKKIQDIKVGEKVMGFDEQTHNYLPVKVLKTFKHQTDSYYILELENKEKLEITGNHLIYTNNYYKKVEDLHIGDYVWILKGWQPIRDIKLIKEKVEVYNLEVAGTHNYFGNNILIHNKQAPPPSSSQPPSTTAPTTTTITIPLDMGTIPGQGTQTSITGGTAGTPDPDDPNFCQKYPDLCKAYIIKEGNEEILVVVKNASGEGWSKQKWQEEAKKAYENYKGHPVDSSQITITPYELSQEERRKYDLYFQKAEDEWNYRGYTYEKDKVYLNTPEGTYTFSILNSGTRYLAISKDKEEKEVEINFKTKSCSFKATANPNPIPQGQNQVTISATQLTNTSLSKCKVYNYSLPYTFTQSASSKTYTINCTGDRRYDNCSDSITVTKAGVFNAMITLSANKTEVQIDEEVKFTANGSGNLNQAYGLDWFIEDFPLCQYHDEWGKDIGKLKGCQKFGGASSFKTQKGVQSPFGITSSFKETLKLDSQGEEVTNLQKILNIEGSKLTISGYFDKATQEALKEFQEKYGLKPTGIVDSPTREKLNELYFKANTEIPSTSLPTKPLSSNQCSDGTICYLCGNQCVKIKVTEIKNLKCADIILPNNPYCECVNNQCQLRFGEMRFLEKVKLYITKLFAFKVQAVDLIPSSSLTYSWSKEGIYKVYVQGKDLKGNFIKSNEVTIKVGKVPPTTTKPTKYYECDYSTGSCNESLTNQGFPTLKDCQDNCYKKSCSIIEFSINGKTNKDQNPLKVWVNTSLKGYFSVNNVCTQCVVKSNDTWGKPEEYYDITLGNTNFTKDFKISLAGNYSFELKCSSSRKLNNLLNCDPLKDKDCVVDNLSLQQVQAINLPFWHEIIPVLPGFLRGLFRR